MKYPERIVEHNYKTMWRFEDCFKGENAFELIGGYVHNIRDCLGMHSHSFYEINIVLSGNACHYIGEKFCAAESGTVFILPPNIKHGYYTFDGVAVFHILLSDAFMRRFGQELFALDGYLLLFEIEPFLRGEYREDLFLKLTGAQLEEIIPILNVIKEMENGSSTNQNILKSCATMALISSLCSVCAQSGDIKNVKLARELEVDIVRCLESIHENCGEKINFKDMAKQYNMSYSTFLRNFKRVCSKTPEQYLLYCRINKAKQLLKNTRQNISEIAQNCGFFDSSHFVRKFKSETGCKPSRYRGESSDRADKF